MNSPAAPISRSGQTQVEETQKALASDEAKPGVAKLAEKADHAFLIGKLGVGYFGNEPVEQAIHAALSDPRLPNAAVVPQMRGVVRSFMETVVRFLAAELPERRIDCANLSKGDVDAILSLLADRKRAAVLDRAFSAIAHMHGDDTGMTKIKMYSHDVVDAIGGDFEDTVRANPAAYSPQ